jgi:NADPH-dependent glutamate synthase beta subunit-like oxidoreductase
LGNRVGIIGGGNTAIDTSRTALRLGSKEITIFYRRTRAEMPAIAEEIEAAIEEGAKIEFLVTPTQVISENGRLKGIEFVRTKLGEPDLSGRKRPIQIEGSEFVVELDSLLPAVSQDTEIPSGFGVQVSRGNAVVVDKETLMTTREGVFACGDAVTLPADVTTAMAEARNAAELIHKYLRGEEMKREHKLIRPSIRVEPIELTEGIPETTKPKMPTLPSGQTKSTFDEVELGYTKEMAMKEARRCLRCDWELQKLREADREQKIGVEA